MTQKFHDSVDLQNNTLSNAVIDADNNTLSNIETTDFKAGVIVTSLSGASSNTELPTAKTVYDAIAAITSGSAMFVGDFDASGGTVPTTGTGSAGAILKSNYWRITVAGTITGVTPQAVLEVGDILYARVDNANTGSQFFSVQGNAVPATTTQAGLVALATQAETNAKSVTDKAVTPSALADYSKMIAPIAVSTDGVTTAFTVTHGLGKNLNTLNIVLKYQTSGEQFIAGISKNSGDPTNKIDITTTPAFSGGFNVLISFN